MKGDKSSLSERRFAGLAGSGHCICCELCSVRCES
jgi:hypothetical protein